MNDTFLPGNGFDTYEEQDKVLVGMTGSLDSCAACRILQQQGFAVAGAVVRTASTAEQTIAAAKQAAQKMQIECVTLNLQADDSVVSNDDSVATCLSALITAADKLGIQYVATGHYARASVDNDGSSCILPSDSSACDQSAVLRDLPKETLSRLILPLGEFVKEDIQEMAQELGIN